jgi:hypothetical protein
VSDPTAVASVTQKQAKDEQEIAEYVSKGEKPVKLVYHDGDSHESFRTALAGSIGSDGSMVVDTRMRDKFGDVSRPEGLSSGPQQIALDDSGATKPQAPSTALAFASMKPAPATATPVIASRTKVANAAPAPAAAPVQSAASGSAETPFYKKMFNSVGDLFSTAPASEPAAETAQVPATTPLSSAKPQPVGQKRAQTSTKVNVAAVME